MLCRKKWRAVSEKSVRSSTDVEMESSNLEQSDERLIYEVQQGKESTDVDFYSIAIDGGLENDILQQRLHTVLKQREQLQHMEIGLRAHVIAKSNIMEIHSTFDAQIKKHANANIKLQEQLHKRGQQIHELETKIEEKERELNAIRLDNEAAWAKEDLLREQSKELQSYRDSLMCLWDNNLNEQHPSIGERWITRKLKECTILNKSMTFGNILKGKSSNSWNCKKRFKACGNMGS